MTNITVFKQNKKRSKEIKDNYYHGNRFKFIRETNGK
jgi:hypothetical protein